MYLIHVKSAVKEFRIQSGLRIESVAVRLSKSYATIRSWEAGYSKPTLNPSQMLKLCEMYGCSLEQLAEAVKGSSGCDEVKIDLVLGSDGVYQ